VSFYEDSTVGDLPVIIALITASGTPLVMAARFYNATLDPDLEEVLKDLASDYDWVDAAGSMASNAASVQSAEALQGIEDRPILYSTVECTSDGMSVRMEESGTIVLP